MNIEARYLDRYFVTSDTHFGHKNILGSCNRPFDSIEEMDESLIESWNNVVGMNDTIFHLGDFTLGTKANARNYFSQLHGRIKILRLDWHHDGTWLRGKNLGESFFGKNGVKVELLPPEYMLNIDIGKTYPLGIHLSHYPLGEWDRKHYGAIHFHGHSHGKYIRDYHLSGDYCIDVGVDSQEYRPKTLRELLESIEINI